jgi:AcrR family transcriptional regulator
MEKPRQERAVRTRETILRAAAAVFDEYGYSGSSITRIMDRAGTTQGALYFHFKGKEDLARAVINEQAAELTLPQDPAGLDQLVEVTMYLATEMQRNVLFRAGVTLAVEQGELGLRDFSVYQMWIGQFRQELAVAAANGELLPAVDTTAAAETLVAAYTGSQVMSQLFSKRADLPMRIARLWRFLLPGIAVPQIAARLINSLEPAQPTDADQATPETADSDQVAGIGA